MAKRSSPGESADAAASAAQIGEGANGTEARAPMPGQGDNLQAETAQHFVADEQQLKP